MKKPGFHILRLGLAITFLWIGIMIWRAPEVWGGYLQPWAAALLLVSIKNALLVTAVLDIVIGLLLLFNIFTWLAALVGALHILTVLITAGVNAITVRDIGLLAAALALFFDSIVT